MNNNKIANVYRRNLLKKAFFPWRRYSYHHLDSPTEKVIQTQCKDKHHMT